MEPKCSTYFLVFSNLKKLQPDIISPSSH